MKKGVLHSFEEHIISEQHRSDNANNIKKALNTLTKRQGQAVHLKYFDNRSYAEIAAEMGIGVDAVYNLVSKALGNIQVQLQSKFVSAKTRLN